MNLSDIKSLGAGFLQSSADYRECHAPDILPEPFAHFHTARLHHQGVSGTGIAAGTDSNYHQASDTMAGLAAGDLATAALLPAVEGLEKLLHCFNGDRPGSSTGIIRYAVRDAWNTSRRCLLFQAE